MLDKRRVQSFDRGLDVLMYLNRYNGASIGDIVSGTGINRGIVYRLLETLRQRGFIRKSKESADYWLTEFVYCLSDGFRNEAWIENIAKPEIEKLTRALVWPISLVTLSGSSMQVRVTSDYVSPLVFDRFPIGFRFSLNGSASGYVYVAFCSAQERNTILSVVKSIDQHSSSESVLEDDMLLTKLKQVREQGYALVQVQQKVTALAVPIHINEMVYGALTMRYFSTALSPRAAVEKFLPALKETADRIASSVYQSYKVVSDF
jgi:IclR family mhp operon transcriptional activator